LDIIPYDYVLDLLLQCLTKIHVSMPPSSFWSIGEAKRELYLADLSGISELQREVLEQTAERLSKRVGA
jgi:hypothetical protein